MANAYTPEQTADYDRALPRKRMAAGVLFFDVLGRLLLVEPTYKPTWEIPGGAVESDESPRAGAAREVLEELGLVCRPGMLLGMDWTPPRAERSEGLIAVFDGGVLDDGDIARIRLQEAELRGYAFVPVDESAARLSPPLARRVAACADARADGRTVYLEDGRPAL